MIYAIINRNYNYFFKMFNFLKNLIIGKKEPVVEEKIQDLVPFVETTQESLQPIIEKQEKIEPVTKIIDNSIHYHTHVQQNTNIIQVVNVDTEIQNKFLNQKKSRESIETITPSRLSFIADLFTKSVLQDVCRKINFKSAGKKEIFVDYVVQVFKDQPKTFLNCINKDDLKCACEALGSRVSGIKEDLIERIINDVNILFNSLKKY